ncbi:MAG: hypothetical protein GTO02_16850, partial [Candidatus Dadabacteria bacterium]|nr:hypothetical protein [Candidatus Dadabacteria bacterium]
MMLGFNSEEEVINRPIFTFFSREDREWIGEMFTDAKKGNFSEFEFTDKDGKYYLSSFIPITDTNGQISHLMGIT